MSRLSTVRVAILVLPLLVASSRSFAQTTGGPVAGKAPVKTGKVLVMAVADGKERSGDPAVGSGGLVRSAIRDALVARGFTPLASESTSIVEALKEAKELGYEYLLKTAITEWEDNATAWSGKKDSIALSLELYDLTPTLIASSTHRQKGSSFAMTDSGPDRLLAKAVEGALGRVVSR